MRFEYGYRDSSAVVDTPDRTDMRFSPDTKREPTFFRGELEKGVAFREAISALHDVVVSDLRYRPKDRTEYLAWLAQTEMLDWAQVDQQRTDVTQQLEALRQELGELNKRSAHRLGPFRKARQRYFDYLYRRDYDTWFVLDPVITVHPDEIFFECFSQDESTYGRLGTSYEVYKEVGELSCGTTNVDYSQGLYDSFQKIRSYKTTHLEVDPSGFEVKTKDDESFKEVKIDLPDSWVRGFLQVSSAMTLPMTSFSLHPMDVHNFCFVLHRHKEVHGPRGMRYLLTPGEPVRVIFEPWEIEVVCGRSIYEGPVAAEYRLWGRRRLHVLERLVSVAERFTVHLLGTGLPCFYVADLGHLSFTLGLSGWTANDWAKAGHFDLMAPRASVDELTMRRVFDGLREKWLDTPDGLASRLDLDHAQVLGALSVLTQAGRAMFDLNKGLYRARELSREPLPADKLRFANERESVAQKLVDLGGVKCKSEARPDGAMALRGKVRDGRHKHKASLLIDSDQRMLEGQCDCNFYQQNKLYKGPCEHILALRLGRDQKWSFKYFL